ARLNGGDVVILDITDTGPGVAPENLERIFEPLFTTKARGIGLGLAVSRSLAQANGGDLAVSSDPGRGATFSFAMPAAGDTA
ncbi:MAG TPA: ATP-binding protein, partial [Gemmatimonadales bacterium]|nr:ATP-binding protein [Gemmatimonadales bacterium]